MGDEDLDASENALRKRLAALNDQEYAIRGYDPSNDIDYEAESERQEEEARYADLTEHEQQSEQLYGIRREREEIKSRLVDVATGRGLEKLRKEVLAVQEMASEGRIKELERLRTRTSWAAAAIAGVSATTLLSTGLDGAWPLRVALFVSAAGLLTVGLSHAVAFVLNELIIRVGLENPHEAATKATRNAKALRRLPVVAGAVEFTLAMVSGFFLAAYAIFLA